MTKHPPYLELKKKITMLQEELAKKEADKTVLRINQKRLQSLWKLASMTDSDFKTVCGTLLEEIVGMSERQYGFYGFISDDDYNPELGNKRGLPDGHVKITRLLSVPVFSSG